MLRFHSTRGMKILFAFVLVMVMSSMAFGDATEQLIKAAKSGKITAATIRRLVESGADVNAKDEEGLTALMFLAGVNDEFNENKMNIKTRIEAINTLIEYGADVNTKASDEYGNTALMYAAWNEQSETEVVNILVKAGADVNAKDNQGYTALMTVHKPESVKALIKAGADINAKTNDGSTVLMEVALCQEFTGYNKERQIEIVRLS